MAKRSVLDILASTGPIQANVELGEGCKTRLSIPGEYGAALTLDVEFLVQATLDGNQKVNGQGLLKISLPKAAVVADGKLTGKTASRAAFRAPDTVAACLYASAGQEVPDDLLTPPKAEPTPELTPADAAKAQPAPKAKAKDNGKPQPAAV
jgi:hypothetical protein